ncbi:NmrA family transcriptional regulator [Streptomyces sp. BE20]|uniref:NmrA family transcriptional regulator n=1 Tax=Streptomyces sp. BE20 TaxID=3002525 RepID=UPI002E76AA12|nr:NmrA family transcriptional regulator [Streptomyces sp. BE20]MEE1824883.1 NmrA family transcriptional regulator [Streptomyces sp. BE20]
MSEDTKNTQTITPTTPTTSGTTVLVTGGTGKTGRRVADRLTALGHTARIGSRTAPVPFDWSDESTWDAALDGVTAAYLAYYPDLAFPGAVETVGAFSRRAAKAGVERLVLLSGRGEEAAQAAEEAVAGAGTGWSVVRCAWFNQNFSESFLLEAVLAGELALPAGVADEPFVDVDDIADVAVAALTEDGHHGQVYELTGPRLLSFADVAAELSAASGREIRHRAVTPDEFREVLAGIGLPGEFADLFTMILDGRNAFLADGVQRALGRPPRDFVDYARAAAASGVWNT